MKVTNLKTLHQTNPLGIDCTPYFSWMLESDVPDTMQASYHIQLLEENGSVVWDSGTVDSDCNTYIPYPGDLLKSRHIYQWTVTVTDNHGQQDSASAQFETAFLNQTDWAASWIKAPMRRRKGKAGFGKQDPATLFRRAFVTTEKPVKARLYATCHGAYESSINGRRISDRTFAPEHTVYEKYLCYQTYDVTDFIQTGDNVLGFYVGDGWYHCPQALPNMKKIEAAHCLLFQLELTYADGTVTQILSDEEVKASYGPIRSSDLYAGELYDATLEIENWDCPGFDDQVWKACKPIRFTYDNLVAQYGEAVKTVKELPVQQVLKSPKGEYILDFGQVIAGRLKLQINAPRGTKITLDHCEVLDKEGNFFNNIMGAGGVGKGCDQRDVYISNGKKAVYEPHFTYHGFRYVRVDGMEIAPETVTACVLSTEKENIGTFRTSDARLNRLYENIRWSQTANMLSIPTDCPQREKAGWTGDMLVYAKTALHNEDCTAFFTRWLKNMACDQDEYGIIPMVVPQDGAYPMTGKFIQLSYGEKGSANSSGWGDAAVVVPYSMYQVTGNTAILQQQYECMKGWCDYIIRQAANKKPKHSTLAPEIENYLWDTGYHYGEWLIPSQNENGMDMKNLKQIMAASACYTAPIFGWNSVQTFAKIAGILAENTTGSSALCVKDSSSADRYAKDAAYYQEIADKMKLAFQKGVIRADGSMPSDLMGAYVLPIYFDLVPEQWKETFAANLVSSIEKNGMRMDTGFLGTPYLLDALCKIGRMDLAYALLWQDKKPSWLYEVDCGGTTIWENCYGYDADGNPGRLSFNHYAFGCVADWIFRNLGGIDTDQPGYKHLIIAPKPDGKLTSVSRTFRTMQGLTQVHWKIAEESGQQIFTLSVCVPCNTTATVILPDGATHEVESGSYEFTTKL